MQTVKCVIVGDCDAAKTSLLISYISGHVKDYNSEAFDNYPIKLMFRNEPFILNLTDTPGHKDYKRLRPLIYPDTDVFLICFSIHSKSSYQNVKKKWIPEIKRYCKNTPFVLVGTQIHLRNESGSLHSMNKIRHELISFEKGEKLAKKIKAFKYVECSAVTNEGLNNVFDVALEAALGIKDKAEDEEIKDKYVLA